MPILVDDWEDGDVAEYTAQDNNGGATYSAVTSPVQEGNYAGQIDTSGTGGTLDGFYATESSGLNHTPDPGDTFRVYMYNNPGDGSSQINLRNSNNSLRFRHDYRNGDIEIYNSIEGATVASTALSVSGQTWYEYVGEMQPDGTVSWTIYDTSGSQLATCSGTTTLPDPLPQWEVRFGWFDVTDTGSFDYGRVTKSSSFSTPTSSTASPISGYKSSRTASVTAEPATASGVIATAITPGYIVWSASDDWDSSQREENVQHSSDVVSLDSSSVDGELLSNKKVME